MISQFYAVRGQKIQTKLFKLLLPIFGSIFGSANINRKDLSKIGLKLEEALPKALTTLSQSLDPDEFQQLMLELLSSTYIDKKMIDDKLFNDVFAGNYFFMFKLAYETIIANNFFDFGGIGIDLSNIIQTIPPEKNQ